MARPYGQAERALGRLAHGLDTTALHATWLWRELSRISVTIARASGYHAKVDQLRAALIGAPVEREDSTPGLAAARRVFLASAELFREHRQADSNLELWPRFWTSHRLSGEPPQAEGDHDASRAGGVDGSAEEVLERDQLMQLVRELAGFADDGRRPVLINLFIDLRQHAATRHLSPQLMRIVLPLAIREAGLVPKAAPGLLGGRRRGREDLSHPLGITLVRAYQGQSRSGRTQVLFRRGSARRWMAGTKAIGQGLAVGGGEMVRSHEPSLEARLAMSPVF